MVRKIMRATMNKDTEVWTLMTTIIEGNKSTLKMEFVDNERYQKIINKVEELTK